MRKTIITLSGFGDFSENHEDYKQLKKSAKHHGVEFYPTYYDHELKGTVEDVEAVTLDMWSMPRDQWADNGLTESV